MLDLRPYQSKVIEDLRQSFKRNKKVILTAPTGSGKTCIAQWIVKSAMEKGKRIAFIVDRLTLLDQTVNVMDQVGIDFGIIQGNHELTDFSKQFQICSAQTLARRGINDFDFVIVDESHIMFKHQLQMLKNANGSYFLGLTATPFTRGLGKYWDGLVQGPSVSQLIKDGFLSEYVIYGPSKPDLRGVRTTGGDYNKKDLAKKTDTKKLIGDIVEHWLKMAQDRRTIVMAVNVAHAEHIADRFKEEGIKAGVVHTYMEDHQKQKAILDFRNGEIQMLTSVDMISRGFDMPQADCLIIARPTKSLNYHLQAIGRVLRPAAGKENALILDHAGNVERLGFPDDEFEMTLDMGGSDKKKREKKERLPKPCSKCFFMKQPGQQVCPNCGHIAERQSNVTTVEGDLVQLQKHRHKETTLENKLKLYAKLRAGAKVLGMKDGWASWKYREHYGVWPSEKVEPDEAFGNWLSSQPRWRQTKIVWNLVK